jgi:hypothetical protein
MKMSTREIAHFLILWSASGASGFLILVVFLFHSGLVFSARKRDGTLKGKIPLRGILTMAAFLAIIIGFFLLADYRGVVQPGQDLGYSDLYLLNYGLYVILFIFDTLIIDGLLLSLWRPGFLKLPDELGKESMKTHILKSLPVGMVAGLVLAAIATSASWMIWLR